MGFFDSESKQSSASGQSGAQTQTGNSYSVNVSGGKYTNPNIKINNYQSDYGAIDASYDFARDAANGYAQATSDAFEFAGDAGSAYAEATTQTIASMDSIAKKAIDFSDDALDVFTTSQQDTIKSVGDSVGKLANDVRGAISSETSRLSENFIKFGTITIGVLGVTYLYTQMRK